MWLYSETHSKIEIERGGNMERQKSPYSLSRLAPNDVAAIEIERPATQSVRNTEATFKSASNTIPTFM